MRESFRNGGKGGVATGRLRELMWIAFPLLLAGCGPGDAEKEGTKWKQTSALKPVLVELADVRRGDIEEILERSAALEAEAQVQVLARTQNPAIELLVEEGDKVQKGQVLLRLESDRQRTDYDQALSQLEQARIDFERIDSLYRQNLISESEFRTAKFSHEQATLRAENARRDLEYTNVRAPISGTITHRTVKVGDSVSTGTPIFEIIDLDSTVAVIHVPEQYVPKLRSNMQARLVSATLGGRIFAAYVKRIAPIVDAQAGTIKVVVAPRELGDLRPGMWVDVELILDAKEDAILIEKRAIVYENDQTYAYKVHTDTNGVRRARRELVIPRNTDKVHIEPAGGFEEGDRIVVAGQSGLKDDSPIRELKDPKELPSGERTDALPSSTNIFPAAGKGAGGKDS